jgi:hypothetical protein
MGVSCKPFGKEKSRTVKMQNQLAKKEKERPEKKAPKKG